jgi:hypothetical protein
MKWIDAGDIKYWLTAKRLHCDRSNTATLSPRASWNRGNGWVHTALR